MKKLFRTPVRVIAATLLVIAAAFADVVLSSAKSGAPRQGELRTSRYVYTGGVTAGKQNGYGVCRYTNGNVYYGFWNMGYKEGLGRLDFADGSIEFGKWNQGILAKKSGKKFRVGQKVYGIDVAKYQKKIDWEKLSLRAAADGSVSSTGKNGSFLQPVLFALMKSTEGTNIRDPQFERNFAESKRCGIVRGAYHFLNSNVSAQAQAKYFISNTPLEVGDLPPVLDLEIPKKIMERDHRKIIKMALEWLKLVEEHYGVRPIIYTYENYYKNYLRGHGFDKYDLWIARYGKKPSAGHWQIWQFTDKGNVSGINHAVDIDIFRGDYAAFKKYVKEKGIRRNRK